LRKKHRFFVRFDAFFVPKTTKKRLFYTEKPLKIRTKRSGYTKSIPKIAQKTRPRKFRRRAKMGDADDEKEYIARAG